MERKFKTREGINQVKFILCPSSIPTSCNRYGSCRNLLKAFPAATSDYYSLVLNNGSIITIYCDMEGSNCDGNGGCMRVGYLNMSEPGGTCSPGLTLQQFNNIYHGVCGLPMSSSTVYSVYGFQYNQVCGQLRGYIYGSPDAFTPLVGNTGTPNIENCTTYVDGVTITCGNNPRKHIWTYAGGLSEGNGNGHLAGLSCPCNFNSFDTTVPSFVGNHYYC